MVYDIDNGIGAFIQRADIMRLPGGGFNVVATLTPEAAEAHGSWKVVGQGPTLSKAMDDLARRIP